MAVSRHHDDGRGRTRTTLLLTALTLAVATPTLVAPDETGDRTGPDGSTTTVTDRVLSAGLPSADPAALEKWPQGPVRYLLSGSEIRLYRGLSTDRERRAFISQFWLRRDPNTSSLENEFRFEFWNRVVEANMFFTRTSVPGWKTDRGKYYIILGPPDNLEVSRMPNRRSGTWLTVPGDSGSADPNEVGTLTTQSFGGDEPSQNFLGLERWTYRSPPGDKVRPNLVLGFQLNSSGNYELSTDPRDWSLYSDMYSDLVMPTTFTDPTMTSPDGMSGTMALYNDVAVALDLGRVTHVLEPGDILGELVTSEEFFGVIPFLLQTDYYKTTGRATLAVFTIGVEKEAIRPGGNLTPEELLAVGKLVSVEDPDRKIMLAGENGLVPSPDNSSAGLLLFQVVTAVLPGSYNARFGILDRKDNQIGSYGERVSVPAFPASGLSLSTLSLARRLTPLEDQPPATEETAAQPFRLGNYTVVPKTERLFANGDEFALYYQIYGAQPDPGSGDLRLDVTYRFFVLQESDFVPIGEPVRLQGRDQSVQGWTFPLRDWPTATFRLEVVVEDIVSGQVTVGQTIFGVGTVETPSMISGAM